MIPDRGPIASFDFRISPKMIDTTDHFWGAFNNGETEFSARVIVRLMQAKGGWSAFSLKELAKVHDPHTHIDTFPLHRLMEPGRAFYIERGWVEEGGGWVVRGEDGLYRVTEEFVERCFKSNPCAKDNL